jgi:hypothetical protein
MEVAANLSQEPFWPEVRFLAMAVIAQAAGHWPAGETDCET